MSKVKNTMGLTHFNWFGNGPSAPVNKKPVTINGMDIFDATGTKVSTIAPCADFKLQRSFNAVQYLTKPEGANEEQYSRLRVEPTDQKFFFDTFLECQKQNGIRHIFGTQGSFEWFGTVGKMGKVYPIKKGEDPMKPESWKVYAELCRQIAIRYADDTAGFLSEARVYDGTYGDTWGGMLTNEPKAGLGLIWGIEGCNEYDFNKSWMNAEYTMTPEQAGVGAAEMYKAVRSVSKTLKIFLPSGIHRDLIKEENLIKSYLAHGGGVDNVYLDLHDYNNDGQKGITPFAAKTFEWQTQFAALANKYGFSGFKIGERGWNSLNEGTKQDVPVLEGYNRQQSVGILMIQDSLIAASIKECVGVNYWHSAENFDRVQYRDGLNYRNTSGRPNWTPKEQYTICANFLKADGETDIVHGSYQTDGTLFSVKTADGKYFVWTDTKKIGNYDAMPKVSATNPIGNPTPPPDDNPPPNPTNMIIGYSTKADRTDFKEITEGQNLPTGNLYIEARNVTPTVNFTLKKEGAVTWTKAENADPYDLHGGQPWAAADGEFTLNVKDKTSEKTVKFSVGTVTPPPPPPTTKPTVTISARASGDTIIIEADYNQNEVTVIMK